MYRLVYLFRIMEPLYVPDYRCFIVKTQLWVAHVKVRNARWLWPEEVADNPVAVYLNALVNRCILSIYRVYSALSVKPPL